MKPAVELDPDLYGRCAREECECVRPGHSWMGRACPHWRPVTRMSADDLIAWLNAARAKKDD